MGDKSGPAFPESYIGADQPHEGIGGGMSMREWYAGLAMLGQIANRYFGNKDDVAKYACECADALIAALKEAK